MKWWLHIADKSDISVDCSIGAFRCRIRRCVIYYLIFGHFSTYASPPVSDVVLELPPTVQRWILNWPLTWLQMELVIYGCTCPGCTPPLIARLPPLGSSWNNYFFILNVFLIIIIKCDVFFCYKILALKTAFTWPDIHTSVHSLASLHLYVQLNTRTGFITGKQMM